MLADKIDNTEKCKMSYQTLESKHQAALKSKRGLIINIAIQTSYRAFATEEYSAFFLNTNHLVMQILNSGAITLKRAYFLSLTSLV